MMRVHSFHLNLTHTKYVHKTVLPNSKISNVPSNVKPTFEEILLDHNVYLTFFLVGTAVHAAEIKQPGARS
jgi:hypothetical protein